MLLGVDGSGGYVACVAGAYEINGRKKLNRRLLLARAFFLAPIYFLAPATQASGYVGVACAGHR